MYVSDPDQGESKVYANALRGGLIGLGKLVRAGVE